MKICKTCKLQLDDDKFAKTRKICRKCVNNKARENYYKNWDQRRAVSKSWRVTNSDKAKAQSKRLDPKKKRERQRKWEHSHPENRLLNGARTRAKSKNIIFNLELQDIHIPKFCPVLGLELKISITGKLQNSSPSLDRIKPELGYVKGNIRVISWRANTLKNNATLEELEKITNDLRQVNYSSRIP